MFFTPITDVISIKIEGLQAVSRKRLTGVMPAPSCSLFFNFFPIPSDVLENNKWNDAWHASSQDFRTCNVYQEMFVNYFKVSSLYCDSPRQLLQIISVRVIISVIIEQKKFCSIRFDVKTLLESRWKSW